MTQFFASIIEKLTFKSALIKMYRREIVDLFNDSYFFSINMLNLRQWQKIMRYLIDGKPDEIFD